MRPDEDTGNRIRDYLLGKLAEDRQQALEEQLMTDGYNYDELLIQEDELIDDFVRGSLPESDEEKFHRHFLCTQERHDKVRFARAFGRYVQSSATKIHERPSFWRRLTANMIRSQPVLQWATAAAFVVVVFGGVISVFENRRLDREIAGLQSEHVALRDQAQGLQERLETLDETNADLADELRRERTGRMTMEQELSARRSPATAPEIASYTLQPGLLRGIGEETPRILISKTLNLLQIQLDIGLDDYASYRAALHDVEGEEIWTQNKLEAETREGKVLVAIDLPSSLLRPGDFSIRLSGQAADGALEPVGRYHFRATQR